MCCNKYFESDVVYDQTVFFFAKNELHLICSTSPIIIPLPIDILERETQQFLLGKVFVRIFCLEYHRVNDSSPQTKRAYTKV